VFDVSDSEYYKKDSSYGIFAGKDCSVMVAKWKAEDRYANLYNTPHYDRLTDDEKESINDMYTHTYEKKYKKVARIWNTVSEAPVTGYEQL
jgi:hypothetical protein